MIAAPTAAFWVYRLAQPISHFRIGTIEHFHTQYQNGDLTRTERDTYIKETIEMGDSALEKSIAHARHKPVSPVTMVEPSPAPQANTSMGHVNQHHPREAFDIPPQRVER
jgi:hypothetical protein